MFAANVSHANDKEGFKDFICHNNYFTAKIPKSWVKYEDIVLGEAAKEYGVNLHLLLVNLMYFQKHDS